MTTKWSPTASTQKGGADKFGELFKDDYAVMLLQGKNIFGDMIYSYVKVAVVDIKRLYAALHAGENFNASDFGTVVAAGKGEPPEEVRAELALTYKMLYPIQPQSFVKEAPASIPDEKKAWDEY